MNDHLWRDNSVVITGAAKGIGRSMAFMLAEQGAWVTMADVDEPALKEAAAQCMERGGRVLAVPTDIIRRDQCERLIAKVVEEYCRIDTLINNAGITHYGRLDDIRDLTVLERIMQTNFMGSVYCTYFALPWLKESRGRIVGMASLAGKTGLPTRTGYTASKHAMVGFFDALRIELARNGVSITMVYPDYVATTIRETALDPDGKPMGRSTMQESKSMPVDECARRTIHAAARRRRELIMGLRGRLGQWLKVAAPGLVDRIALRSITRGH